MLPLELFAVYFAASRSITPWKVTAQKSVGGWIYDGREAFNTLPGSYRCPVCNAPKRRRAHPQLGFLQSPGHNRILLWFLCRLCMHFNYLRCACLCQVQTGIAGERQGQRAEQQQKWQSCCKVLRPGQVHAAQQPPSAIKPGLVHAACMKIHAATLSYVPCFMQE